MLKLVVEEQQLWKESSSPLHHNKTTFVFQTCERERRHREHEARLARQRQVEEERNRRALERALAPPYIKV